jgi:hypothetical protein
MQSLPCASYTYKKRARGSVRAEQIWVDQQVRRISRSIYHVPISFAADMTCIAKCNGCAQNSYALYRKRYDINASWGS